MKHALFCIAAEAALVGQVETAPQLQQAETDITRQPVRRARATWFNVRAPFSMIETVPGRTHPFVRLLHEVQAELPHQEADTIVIGDVVDSQIFLSLDGKGLYTEYSLAVAKILKSTSASFPIPIVDHSIMMLREGGTARLPSGRTVNHDIRNDVRPKLHQKGIFFLTYQRELKAFTYRKFWLVENGVLTPAFPEDIALGSRSVITGKPLSVVASQLEKQINQ